MIKMNTLTEQLKISLLDSKGYVSSMKLSKLDPMLRKTLETLYIPNLDTAASIQERIHWLFTDRKDYPKYENCGNNCYSFLSISAGYQNKICSRKCQYELRSKNKKQKTLLSIEEKAQRHEIAKAQRIKTCRERLGVDFPMESQEIRDKMKSSRHKNWFITRIEAIKNIAIPLFSYEEYNHSKLSYNWQCVKCNSNFLGDIADGSVPRCQVCYPPTISKPQSEIIEFIKTLIGTEEIIINDRRTIYPLELDIYLPVRKIAIEMNGVYWHSEKAGKFDKAHNFTKLQTAKSKDIHLITVFDCEWYNQKELVKSRLSSKLGYSTKIHGRKCKIIIPSKQQAKFFLNENHIQGSDNATHYYGLELNGELVAIMSFGKSRFNQKYQWELLRYCTSKNTTVIGGASKLLKYFEHQHSPSSLISYSDNRWNTGNVYNKLGFIFDGEAGLNFFYADKNGTLWNRLQLQKHKLSKILTNFDNTLSAESNLSANGFYKVWGAGNKRWIKMY